MGYVTIPTLAHAMGAREVGIYSLCVTLVFFLQTIFGLGQATGLGVFYFEFSGRPWKTLVATIWLMTALFAVGLSVLLLLVGKTWVAYFFPTLPFSPCIWVVIGTSFLGYPMAMALTILRAKGMAFTFASLEFGKALLSVLIILIGVVLFPWGIAGAMASLFIPAAVFFPITFWILRHDLHLSFDAALAGKALRLGMPLTLHAFSLLALLQMDRLVLGSFGDLQTVGLFTVGSTVANLFSVAITGINHAWNPFFLETAKKSLEEAGAILGQSTSRLLVHLAGFGLMIVYFSKEIISWIAPESFAASHAVVFPLTLALFLQAVALRLTDGLLFAKRSASLAGRTFLGALLHLLFLVLLVPRFGMIGAAWATTLGQVVLCALLAIPSHKALPIHYHWPLLVRSILLWFVLWMAYENLSGAIPTPILWILVRLGLLTFGFLCVHRLSRASG